jgi:hypothetical protein
MKLANSDNGVISSGILSGIVVQSLIKFTALLNLVRNPARRYMVVQKSLQYRQFRELAEMVDQFIDIYRVFHDPSASQAVTRMRQN